MQFYPPDAIVPATLRTQDLYLTMLAPEHVERDYDAFMSSIPRLQRWSGGSWPTPEFTLAENMDDMIMHSNEHVDREAFTFTVLSPDESRCEGCIYINGWDKIARRLRLSEPPPEARDYDAVTTFWVRESALERDLDRQLVAGLLSWFDEEWSFERTLLMVNSDQQRDIDVLRELGLLPLLTLDTPHEPGLYYFYGRPEASS